MAGRSRHEARLSVYEPLLGTVVELRIDGPESQGDAAREADRRVVAEMRRLERMLTVFDETSELCRWRRGEDFAPSPEVVEVLRAALFWQTASGGAFNPAAGELSGLWAYAERTGIEPDAARVADAAAAVRSPRYAVSDTGAVRRLGDCSQLNFNAMAKGFIVDRAAAAGMAADTVAAITVNAGGDLRHRGAGSLTVGIEDPSRPFDNAAPLMVVDIADRGLATSGSSRRGYRIGTRRHSHVIDPRSGRPVEHIRSATVIAPDAMTADALATVAGVLEPAAGVAFVDGLAGACCCTIDDAGTLWRSGRWALFERDR